MIDVEFEKPMSATVEGQDKEGTYEQKVKGDAGSQTVFTGNRGSTKLFKQDNSKKRKSENVIYTEIFKTQTL